MLAAALERRGAADAGFADYFAKRIARTARVQKGSASNAHLFHKASALGAWAFYGPMGAAARASPAAFHARQDWVYRYDVTAET